MSREIKFRGYDKIIKKVFDVVSISNTTKTLSLERGDVFYSIVGFDEVELMQYTGLTDKNGVEIYEGDIVKIKLENEIANATVAYKKSSYSAYLTEARFYYLSSVCFESEIIGNIYENPELLNNQT